MRLMKISYKVMCYYHLLNVPSPPVLPYFPVAYTIIELHTKGSDSETLQLTFIRLKLISTSYIL